MIGTEGAHGDHVMTLILIRHGRALDIEGRCIGHTDVALSSSGATAIERVAEEWRDRWIGVARPTVIHSSDLCRASESADILGRAWALPVRTDPRLREMSFGEWDGERWETIEAHDAARFQAWTASWFDTAPPGGERLAQVEHRVAEWLRALTAGPVSSREPVVVVSHAGWIRVALSQLRHLPMARLYDIPVDYASVTVVSSFCG